METNAVSTVTSIAEQLLGEMTGFRKEPVEGYILHLEFVAEMIRGFDTVDNEVRDLELLVLRPSNYTQVFYRICNPRALREGNGVTLPVSGELTSEGWKHLCYHDSCWRSDGVSKAMNLAHTDAITPLRERNPRSKKLRVRVNLGRWGKIWRQVWPVITKHPEDQYDYIVKAIKATREERISA